MTDLYKFPSPIPEPPMFPQQRAETIFGHFQTVAAVPTTEPKTWLDQIQYVTGTGLYFYDIKSKTWILV